MTEPLFFRGSYPSDKYNLYKLNYSIAPMSELLKAMKKSDKKLINRIKKKVRRWKARKLYLKSIDKNSSEYKKMSRKEKKEFKKKIVRVMHRVFIKIQNIIIREAFND